MRNIRVRQHPSRLPYVELDRMGLSYLYCELGNKRGFIVGKPGIISVLSTQKYISVTVTEEKKYKPVDQYMRMHMGRVGSTYTDMSTYQARVIGVSQSNQPYTVWEIL